MNRRGEHEQRSRARGWVYASGRCSEHDQHPRPLWLYAPPRRSEHEQHLRACGWTQWGYAPWHCLPEISGRMTRQRLGGRVPIWKRR